MSTVVCACGKPVVTRTEWAGQWIPCPACDGTVYAPFPGPKPAPALLVSAPAKVAVDPGGTEILVVGLLGWMTCLLLSPVAWVMGASYEAKCRARGVEPSSVARAGKLSGIVGTVVLLLSPIYFIASLVLG